MQGAAPVIKGKAQIEQMSSAIRPYGHFPSEKGGFIGLLVITYTVVTVIANTAQSVAYHCQLER